MGGGEHEDITGMPMPLAINGYYRTAHSTNALGLLTLMVAMDGDRSIIYDECYTIWYMCYVVHT